MIIFYLYDLKYNIVHIALRPHSRSFEFRKSHYLCQKVLFLIKTRHFCVPQFLFGDISGLITVKSVNKVQNGMSDHVTYVLSIF